MFSNDLILEKQIKMKPTIQLIKKHGQGPFLLIIFLGLLSGKCESDSPESCDCDELIAHDESITVSPNFNLPIDIGLTYSRNNGLSAYTAISFPLGNTGLKVTLTECMSLI